MAAFLLHLTLVEECASRSPDLLPHPVRRRALLLGAGLPDLPYYEQFPGQVVRHLLGLSYRTAKWAAILHTRRTGGLARALLMHIYRAQLGHGDRDEVHTLLAGYLCHHAVDIVFHPAINDGVRTLRRAHDRPAAVLHQEIEDWQSRQYHAQQLGHRLWGSNYPAQITSALCGGPWPLVFAPRAAFGALTDAALQTHGRSPSRTRLAHWLRGVSLYGKLMSSRLADRPSQSDAVLADSVQRTPDQLCESAIELTLVYWRQLRRILDQKTLTSAALRDFAALVRDVDLDLGPLAPPQSSLLHSKPAAPLDMRDL